MAGLDLVGDGHIYYKSFIERLKSKLIFVKPDQILKFCFDVFDANNNRSICMQDMTTFSNTFAGVCVELMHDYLDISRVLLQKSRVYQNKEVANFDYERGEPFNRNRGTKRTEPVLAFNSAQRAKEAAISIEISNTFDLEK